MIGSAAAPCGQPTMKRDQILQAMGGKWLNKSLAAALVGADFVDGCFSTELLTQFSSARSSLYLGQWTKSIDLSWPPPPPPSPPPYCFSSGAGVSST